MFLIVVTILTVAQRAAHLSIFDTNAIVLKTVWVLTVADTLWHLCRWTLRSFVLCLSDHLLLLHFGFLLSFRLWDLLFLGLCNFRSFHLWCNNLEIIICLMWNRVKAFNMIFHMRFYLASRMRFRLSFLHTGLYNWWTLYFMHFRDGEVSLRSDERVHRFLHYFLNLLRCLYVLVKVKGWQFIGRNRRLYSDGRNLIIEC